MNIAGRLPKLAESTPEKIAVVSPQGLKPQRGKFQYESLTFKELDELSLKYAHGLLASGLKAQDKVLLFVRPSVRFSALAFALFRAGLIPIFIDPGMGRKNLLRAVEQIKPDGLLAEPEVHFLRLIFRKSFKSVRSFVTTGKLTWGQMSSIHSFQRIHNDFPYMSAVKPQDTAAILFTSGGTGIPKGVRYTHKIFNAQVERLQEIFNLDANEVDLPGFPLFSLFTITMGMKSVIPAMNPSKPAHCHPAWLVKNIQDHGVSFAAGSPAIWDRVAKHCLANKITLPSIKYLVMFGAPVTIKLHQDLQKLLPNGDTYTPYGATECLPVSCLSGKEILAQYAKKMKAGHGTCVGRAVPETTIKIAPICAQELNIDAFEWHKENTLGEICVLADTVTPEYVGMPEQTRLAKIKEADGKLWHRMGDLGYLDDSGVLWFCGRKSHAFSFEGKTFATIPHETPFLDIEGINKVALVGPLLANKVTPSLVIENKSRLSRKKKATLKAQVHKKAQELALPLQDIYFCNQFPVDIRHNIKIDRLKLKEEIERGNLL